MTATAQRSSYMYILIKSYDNRDRISEAFFHAAIYIYRCDLCIESTLKLGGHECKTTASSNRLSIIERVFLPHNGRTQHGER